MGNVVSIVDCIVPFALVVGIIVDVRIILRLIDRKRMINKGFGSLKNLRF